MYTKKFLGLTVTICALLTLHLKVSKKWKKFVEIRKMQVAPPVFTKWWNIILWTFMEGIMAINALVVQILHLMYEILTVLGGTLEPRSSENIGHSDLISGFQGDISWTSQALKLDDSRSSGYRLCPANGRPDRRTDGQTDGRRTKRHPYTSVDL